MLNYPATLNVPWRLRFLGGGRRFCTVDAFFAQNAVPVHADRDRDRDAAVRICHLY